MDLPYLFLLYDSECAIFLIFFLISFFDDRDIQRNTKNTKAKTAAELKYNDYFDPPDGEKQEIKSDDEISEDDDDDDEMDDDVDDMDEGDVDDDDDVDESMDDEDKDDENEDEENNNKQSLSKHEKEKLKVSLYRKLICNL